MKSYYAVTCQACGKILRVPSRILPPLHCSCGSVVDIPADVELISEAEVVRETRNRLLDAQRAMWNQLHRFAVVATDEQWQSRRTWFKKWQAAIPNIGCNCRKHWIELVNEFPPDFSSREAFFAWTVEAHNRVNQRPDLNKPVMPLEEALRLYGMWIRRPADVPRVGFLSACYMRAGGTETWARTLLPRLSSVRVDGLVAAYLEEGDPAPLGCQYGAGMDSTRRLAEAVDVLVVWGIGDLQSLLPAQNRPKVVLVHHGDLNNQWFQQYIENQAACADAVVTINADVAEHARKVLSCRVEHIPNAVTDDRITPTEWLKKEKPTVVWCHRFSDEKRVQLAVDAARLMPDWQFFIIGKGPDQPKNIPANVAMLGAQDSQANWLAVADVFLSTTWMEGFGLSMAEAMLAGVPVVATPFGLGAHADLVEQLPEHPTPEEIADGIRRARGNSRRAVRARRFIQQNHGVDQVVPQWERLLTELASGS